MINYKDRFKYRVWHKEFGRFLTGEEWCMDMSGRLLFFDITENKLLPCDIDKFFTIQPCTGAVDKNKKLIFEGDVVKVKRCHTVSRETGKGSYAVDLVEDGEEVGIVLWLHYRYSICYSRYDDFDDFDGIDHRLEVIGNVCESEELIKDNRNYM